MTTKFFQTLFLGHWPQLHILTIENENEDWGAGQSQDSQLPPAPSNLRAIPDHGRTTITWDPVPQALYYNLYFVTTKGVQIKPCELARPIASPEDFVSAVGIKKTRLTALKGSPHPTTTMI